MTDKELKEADAKAGPENVTTRYACGHSVKGYTNHKYEAKIVPTEIADKLGLTFHQKVEAFGESLALIDNDCNCPFCWQKTDGLEEKKEHRRIFILTKLATIGDYKSVLDLLNS